MSWVTDVFLAVPAMMSRPHPGRLRILIMMIMLRAGRLQVRVDEKVYAWLGSNVTLKCTVETLDHVTQITWQRRVSGDIENFLTYNEGSEPRHLTPFARKVKLLRTGAKDGSIVIGNVTLADEGTYFCIFTIFPAGPTKAETNLQIWVEPVVRVDLKPVIESRCPDVVAECVVAPAKPMAEVVWITNGNNYTSKEKTTQQTDGTMSVRSELYMTPTLNLYGQGVTCLVYQPEVTFAEQRNVTDNVTLTNIQYAPQTVYTEARRKAGGFLQLQCQGKANPAATYAWRRENQLISMDMFNVTTGILSVHIADSDGYGLYICEAANIVGVNTGSVYLYQDPRRCRVLPVLTFVLILLFIVILLWYSRLKVPRLSCKKSPEKEPGESHARDRYTPHGKQQPDAEVDSSQEQHKRKEDVGTTTDEPSHGRSPEQPGSKF
ncbi:nectin 1a-like [Mixophyes fleayi]|uniref:nectin 1a-like n=1 Tax=Mixophyes fleayi TaxID=3061075 RepID=UPI003F4E2CAF